MKSNSLKVGLLFTLVVFEVFLLGSAFAQQSVKPLPKGYRRPTPHIPHTSAIVRQTDLGIVGIGNKHWEGECSACSNTLARVGAIYLNDLTVGVNCDSDSVEKTGGTVQVTYYDLVQGRSVTISKNFSNLSCQRQPRDILVTVVNHPILIKRGTGIQATVKPHAHVEDSNPGNNRMTVRDPSRMCIQHRIY